VSDKVEVWEQLPYLISGGFGGAALVGLGVTAFLANEHREDRLRTAELLERVERRMDELEMAIAAELDELPSRVAAAPKSRARS